LYGASEFSRDVDILILADEDNLAALAVALGRLRATVIAVPPFEARYLAQGHAVHFRCEAEGCDSIRLDVMAKMRGVVGFAELWARRTTLATDDAGEVNLFSVYDLVQSKKTQRDKDWPMIKSLLEVDYLEHQGNASEGQRRFWLMESRTVGMLVELCEQYPGLARALSPERPLLAKAVAHDLSALASMLEEEEQVIRSVDRTYWLPLRKELELLRRGGSA
jgi:hypothetical protein